MKKTVVKSVCNDSTWEAEEGGSLQEQVQPGYIVRFCLRKQNEMRQHPGTSYNPPKNKGVLFK